MAGAAVIAAVTVAAAPGVIAEPTAIPGVDQPVSSKNVKHLANLPKQGPFDDEAAFGSDLAFQGHFAYVGNYNGFAIYDIRNAHRPRLVTQVLCPGSQNDISVSGDLLFLSTDSARTDDSCQSTQTTVSNPNEWEGIKIFDISNKLNPRYVKSVETDCGSHTHTLVPAKHGPFVYIYVQSYNPSASFPKCQPPHDYISIVKVPRDHPEQAAVIAKPVLFPDGGNPGRPTNPNTSATSGCHDMTVFPQRDIAAGACMGDGILLDISDREAPRVIDQVQDNVNFAFWHSATFNNTGTKVVFTDELGGGGGATCNERIGPNRGADGIYDIVGTGDQRRLEFRGYFKIPRMQADTENCVAHNGSLIPVRGRDIMVQAWYQGGLSIWDFTDSSNPREIGFSERGPLSDEDLSIGGAWSAYYYNGNIYASDIQKGFDVLDIHDPLVAGADRVRFSVFNAQTQQAF